MLFWAKTTVARGLIALALLAATACGLSVALGVTLLVHPTPRALGLGVTIWLAILASDLVIHGVFTRFGGARYQAVGAEFREYCREMTPAARVVGGLVAGLGEEPLFRGVALTLLVSSSPAVGLLVTSALFGAAHYLRPSLRLLAVWAAWQGFLLGLAYLLTGSLAAVMLAHFLHDTSAYFALARR